MALVFGQYRRAIVSFTTATRGAPGVSAAVNVRPYLSRVGTPIKGVPYRY